MYHHAHNFDGRQRNCSLDAFRSGEALDDKPATKRIKIVLETLVETKPCPKDTVQVETVEEDNGQQDELWATSTGSLKATEAVKVKATDELRTMSDGSLKATDNVKVKA
jgi:hypothetical protein